MPVYTLHVYECDEEECSATVTGNSYAEARGDAAAQGWSVFSNDDIRCRDHRAYEKCAKCSRDMRPWNTPKALHPSTVAPGSGGLCSTCTDHKRRGKPNSVIAQDAKMEAAVARYVSMRTPEFREVFNDPRPLEHEARKAAPQDLWPILGL